MNPFFDPMVLATGDEPAVTAMIEAATGGFDDEIKYHARRREVANAVRQLVRLRDDFAAGHQNLDTRVASQFYRTINPAATDDRITEAVVGMIPDGVSELVLTVVE